MLLAARGGFRGVVAEGLRYGSEERRENEGVGRYDDLILVGNRGTSLE
jgi:hypothetical protein